MRPFGIAVAAAALTVSVTGCAPKTPDYQSIWATSSTTSAAPTTTGKPVPLSKYLESNGVTGEPVAPNALTDLTVSIPTPPGWAPHGDPKAAPNAVMIAKGDKYPAALLVVFKLRGDFNPAEAITHANADLPEGFKQLDASTANFNGFPSSMIQGSYDLKGARMHSYSRVVIATGAPPTTQRYLVQLTITSLADEAVTQSNDIEAIIRGFVVAAK
ncbi:LpqN/LpqT family lipoprotein [Mycobacterium riyadhense]|uniref:LpqN/LpqT family lipoprotein n=1 Tax=Mycobacterium riyadhense TaxID=486698 RepID=UPI00195D878F|nr:LpqN/LpqT family lipoprotein [Mycobacterium riyadhense]